VRILMTTDTVGGVWTYSLELAHALAPHDVQISLATLGARLTAAQRAEVEALENVDVFESGYRLEWMENAWDDISRSQDWVRDIARRVQPDMIHANTYCHAAMEWDIPLLLVGHSCVCSWHQEVRSAEAGPEWDRYRTLVAEALQRADFVIAPTRAMLAMLERHYGRLRRKRAILNGLPSRKIPAAEKENFVFTAGRLWDEGKNVAAVARAAPQIKWPVRVAGIPHPDGDGVEVSGVEFLGRRSTGEMRDLYARAPIYAHPARYEPFGLTPLEAALGGCALVLGDIPTLREVWGRAAPFVAPDDAAALAKAVNRLIDNPPRRRGKAERAYVRALDLNSQRQAESYMSAYLELLAAPRRRLQEVP
jgi:glycogen synthase